MFYQILILVALVQIIYGSLPRDNIHGVTIPSPSDSPTAANRRKRGSSRGWRIQNNSLGKGDGVDEGESHSPLYGTSDASPIQHSIEHSTEFIAQCNMPTRGGYYTMRSYKYSSPRQALEPIVMIAGDVRGKENVLVRVHDQCFTSEVFGSLRCDCKEQLQQALDMISDAANNDGTGGIVIYLQQEGRGIGLANKIAAYALQDTGLDTVEANTHLGFEEELREYLAVPDILQDLDIKSIRLITNNPFKIEQLETLGVSIRDRIPLLIQANEFNEQYLRSKKEKMRHWLKDEMINLPIESAAVRTARRQASGDSSALQAPTIDQKIKQQAQQLQQQHYQQQQQQHTIQAKADQPHIEQPKQLQRRHPAQSKKSTKQSKGQFHAENVPSINGGATESETRAEEAKEKNSNMPTKAMLVAGGSTQVVGKAPANKSHDSIDARRAAAVQECGGYIFGRASVEAAIADVKAGKPVIVVDDADRENEGDLIMAAEMATAESIGYIIRYSSGVLCVALEGERLDKLKLPPMVANNEDPKGTAYSISVDHTGTSTGISAADRALTFRKLVDPTATAEEFQRPGHVFPLRYKEGGVRRRAGHTEASLDLSRLAGLHPGGVLAEVVHDDGSMQRLPDLERMAVDHNLVLTSVQDIIAYRVETEFQP